MKRSAVVILTVHVFQKIGRGDGSFGVRYGKSSWGKIKKSGLEMVAFGILAMLLFSRVENHYVDWGWGENVEKVRCQIENGWHLKKAADTTSAAFVLLSPLNPSSPCWKPQDCLARSPAI
jgi:hypothetical protein